MPRKPAKICVYSISKFKIDVDIHLDKASGEFSAEWGDQIFTGPDLTKIKRDITKAVEDSYTIAWIPVLIITIFSNLYEHDEEALVDLSFERQYLAKQDDKWYYTNWRNARDPSRMHRYYESNFKGQIPSQWTDDLFGKHGTTHLLPYNEDLYNGLCAIKSKLYTLGQKLQELIKSEEGLQKISTLPMPLLTEGDSENG
jgi:hypothetical protein